MWSVIVTIGWANEIRLILPCFPYRFILFSLIIGQSSEPRFVGCVENTGYSENGVSHVSGGSTVEQNQQRLILRNR